MPWSRVSSKPMSATTPPSTPDPVPRAPALQVLVSYGLNRRGLPSPASFKAWFEAALGAVAALPQARQPSQAKRWLAQRSPLALSVRIADEAEARTLNQRWRGRDYATNVLSFDNEPGTGPQPALVGDLLLAGPVIVREAQTQGKTTIAHYAHLTVHGVLHVLGFDHEIGAEAKAMEALETHILLALGLPDPWAGRARRRPRRPKDASPEAPSD